MPKEMNRTSGAARRKISKAEEVRYAMKTGKPLTGSASGVKSITTKQAGEVLTQGIVSLRGNKLSVDPAGLAMAVSPYKMISSSLLKGSARLLKPSTGTALEKAAKITAANDFKFNAAIFNTAVKSPEARRSVDKIVKNAVIKAASKDGQDSFFIGKTVNEVMRLGGETTGSFRLLHGVLKPREFRVVQRAIAKILGKAGRSNPAYREIGRDFRTASRPTFKSNLGKRMK